MWLRCSIMYKLQPKSNQSVYQNMYNAQAVSPNTWQTQYHHANHTRNLLTEKYPYNMVLRLILSRALNQLSLLWVVPVNVIELYVLVFLGYDLCLNFSCSVCCTTNKNENRSACKSPKCSQVCSLLNHSRTSSQDCQKC